MKKGIKLAAVSLFGYAVLLQLLTLAESAAPEATINSFWDALWFSLITMTTVGYGDMSPVTPWGRALGIVFAMCSMGVLAAVIGLGVRLVGRQTIPRLRLKAGKKRPWYVFDRVNGDTAAMVENLRRKNEEAVFILPAEGDRLVYGRDTVRIDIAPRRLAELRGTAEGLYLFFMGPDGWDNYRRGLEAAGTGAAVYSMADTAADTMPGNMQLFCKGECLSRTYWEDNPLTPEERTVVLIGCGSAGMSLLERALLTNVFEAERGVSYHVFGDSSLFAQLHGELVKSFKQGLEGEDELELHGESWTQRPDILRGAHRIIICTDRDEENLEIWRQLRIWFPTSAGIHVRLEYPAPDIVSFGSRDEIITPETVMKDAINRRAVTMNDIYNEGSPSPKAWKELSYFHRQSNIAAADHLIVKIRWLLDDWSITEMTEDNCRRAFEAYRELYPEKSRIMEDMEHRRWLRFHRMYNWVYSPERSDTLRRHPLICPSEELSDTELKKDDYSWEMLGRI